MAPARSTKKPKKIKLKAPPSGKDELVGKSVAFCLFGDRDEWLRDPNLLEYGENFQGKLYLLGTITNKDKTRTKGGAYIVEWEHTSLTSTKIDNAFILFEAINLAFWQGSMLSSSLKQSTLPKCCLVINRSNQQQQKSFQQWRAKPFLSFLILKGS